MTAANDLAMAYVGAVGSGSDECFPTITRDTPSSFATIRWLRCCYNWILIKQNWRAEENSTPIERRL